MEIILEKRQNFQKINLYTSMSFLKQQKKITTNSINEQHKSNELDLINCGKTDLSYISSKKRFNLFLKVLTKNIMNNLYAILVTTIK